MSVGHDPQLPPDPAPQPQPYTPPAPAEPQPYIPSPQQVQPAPQPQPAPAIAPAPVAQPPASMADMLIEHGVDGSPADKQAYEQQVRQLESTGQLNGRVFDMLKENSQAADQLRQYQQQQAYDQAQPQAPPAEQTPAPEAPPAWQGQQYKSEFSALPRDANGNAVIRDPMDSAHIALVQEANKYDAFRRGESREQLADPMAYLEQRGFGKVREEMAAERDSAIRQGIQAYHQEQEQRAFLQANQNEMCQLDANGQPYSDPVTGQIQLSPKGQSYQYHIQQGQQFGMQQDAAMAYAQNQMAADEALGRFGPAPQPGQQPALVPPGQPAQQPDPQQQMAPQQFGPPTPQQIGQQRRDTFLDQAQVDMHAQNRTGTVPYGPESPPQNPDQSISDMAKDLLREKGLPTHAENSLPI